MMPDLQYQIYIVPYLEICTKGANAGGFFINVMTNSFGPKLPKRSTANQLGIIEGL
jgi:hypothetical protein